MSSLIRWKEQETWVSNMFMARLLDFAEEVARATTRDEREAAFLKEFMVWRENEDFPGNTFDLEEVFPDLEQKKFWARVFHDLARRVFLRELGLHEATFWQSHTIAVACAIGEWLTRAVQSEQRWYPETEDSREATAWYARVNGH